jgi:hypothetical protein
MNKYQMNSCLLSRESHSSVTRQLIKNSQNDPLIYGTKFGLMLMQQDENESADFVIHRPGIGYNHRFAFVRQHSGAC